ncbi:pulmonary surfactant-associated protein D isoform X2 [Mycteria americana]|uniref:pulmonary surfactant-associated protein D isoform X2 n=1 Tax=Mycteria americana TaxID=33587 RepID=UPI003F585287
MGSWEQNHSSHCCRGQLSKPEIMLARVGYSSDGHSLIASYSLSPNNRIPPGHDLSGEGLRSLQGFPREVGPPEIKGDLGPQREKGQKGECGIVVTDDLQRQVTALETKVRVLEDGLNRYKKALILRKSRVLVKKYLSQLEKKILLTMENPFVQKLEVHLPLLGMRLKIQF